MILHVITNFTASAGAETMLARLLHAARSDRTLVVPLMAVSERNRALAANDSVDYQPLGVQSAAGMAASVVQLARVLRRERPHVVLCWMYHAMVVGALAARLAGQNSQVFWNVRQSLDDPASLSRSTKIALGLSRRLSNWPGGIIFNSGRALDLHREYGFRNDNCLMIPNGFEAFPAAPHTGRAPRTFGIAARLHPQKDHETFFKAAARTLKVHPHARFIAAGAGMTSENADLREMISRSGMPLEAVELRGEIKDMTAFYTDIDVLVLSSRTEGFPNVIAEAMGHGRPAIATDVGDAAAIIGSTGFVVAPSDSRALAMAMCGMLDFSPRDYASFAAAARARIDQKYSLSNIVASYGRALSHTI